MLVVVALDVVVLVVVELDVVVLEVDVVTGASALVNTFNVRT